MATKKTQTAGPAGRGLKVICATEGFRRAGRVFGRDAVTIPLDELSPEEHKAITDEPKLACVEVDLADEAAT